MARRRHQEEHANHEAWAIPYGDLVTLLLAFFVVMYSISSVNEGKYRIVSESLNAAFRGAPTTTMPIQLGKGATTTVASPVVQLPEEVRSMALRQLAQEAEDALSPLIMAGLVDVQIGDGFVEISIRSDVLFASGAAKLAPDALPAIRMLGEALRDFPNSIRVEGHTDNVPVTGGLFPSNWELSAARAASVVHLLIESGVEPRRLSVAAFGEFRPVLPNTTADGRNANRRVVLTIVGSEPAAVTTPPVPAVSSSTSEPAPPAVPAAGTP